MGDAAAVEIGLAQFLRLLVGLGEEDFLQVAEILGPRLVAFLRRRVRIDVPQLDRRLEERRERQVRVTMLRAPYDRFGADEPGDPDRRVRLLERPHPRIHQAEMEKLAFPSKRTGLGPSRDYQRVRLLEVFTVIPVAPILNQLLAPPPSHP